MDLLNVQGINMKKYQSKIKQARKPLILALEPRLLLDGAAVATAVDILTDTQLQSIEDQNTSVTENAIAPTEVRALDTSLNNGRKEVVFIDSNIENYQTLIDGIDEGIEVQLIDGSQDGFAQMAVWADTHTGYDAIHILSHGSEGQIELGNATLNTESLDAYNAELTLLGESLNEEGDLLLYGCEVSQGDDQNFIEQLSQITGADVAASDDLTGSALLGGDWELEAKSGVIETSTLASFDNFESVLANIDHSFETSFDGWTTGGNTTLSEGGDYQANSTTWTVGPSGSQMAVLNAAEGESWSDTTSSLQISSDTQTYITDALGTTNVTQVSYIYQDVALTTGESITFGWNFVATDDELFNDSSFISAVNINNSEINADINGYKSQALLLGSTRSGTGTYATGSYSSTGWQEVTITALESGTYRVAFAVFDIRDEINSPLLFVDDGIGTTFKDGVAFEPVERDSDPAVPVPANSAPSISDVPTDILVAEGVASDVDLSAVTFVDIDADNLTVSITASAGTLSATSSDSVTVGGTSSAISLTGSVASINSFLDSASNIQYTSVLNTNGDNAATLTIMANDGTVDSAISNVNITVANSSPEIQAADIDLSGSVTETEALVDTGSFTFTDVDVSDRPVATVSSRFVYAVAQDLMSPLILTTEQTQAFDAGFTLENLDSNTNDGAVNWRFEMDESELDFLGEGELVFATFTVQVTDDEGSSDTQDVTIYITGSNDGPSIQVVDAAGTITEGATQTDSGSITFTDVDLTDNPTATEATSSVTAIAQDGETVLTLTSAQQATIEAAFSIENVNTNTNDGTVNWSYDISEASLDFFGAGEVVTAVFTITVTDDEGATDTQDVIITLTGTNDAPDIQVDAETGSVTGNIVEGTILTDSGSITFTDLDLTDNPTATEATSSVTAIAQDGETALTLTGAQQAAIEAAFSIENVNTNTNDGTVNWSYNISEANLDFLGAGEVVTAVFTITVTDDEGATDTQDVTITLTGSNDAPFIQVDAVTGSITEGVSLTDSGSISFGDLDLTDNPVATEATFSVTAIAQDGEAALSLTSAQQAAIEAAFSIDSLDFNNNFGTVNWFYDISETNLDFLGASEVVTAVFTITVTDDEGATDTQDVTITLTGTNDTPDIQVDAETGSVTGSIVEGAATEGTTLTDSGSITFTDVDLTDNPTATAATSTVMAVAQDGETALTLTSAQQAAIEAAFSVESLDSNSNNGTVNWSYNISEANLDFLGAGEVVTAVFTITVTDDEGATDTQDVTITLTGTNDAPDIQVDAETASVTGTITEGTTLMDSGSITFTDVDFTDNPTTTEATSSVTAIAQDGETALTLTSAQQAAIEAAFSIENVNTNTNDGTVNWSYNISEADLDFLGAGEVVTAVFTITVTDDEGVTDTQYVTITLTGSNDAPDIQVDAETGSVTGNIVEGATLTDSGSISFTDVDLTDNPTSTEATSTVTAIAQDGETALTLTSVQQTVIEAAFSIENVDTNTNDGTVNWSYNISEANLDFLGAGEVVTAVFTITVTDDEGATDTQDVTITLTGTNDTPDIQLDAETGSVTGNIVGGTTLTDSGSITFTDVDFTDNPTATEVALFVTAIAYDGETALTLSETQQAAIEAAFSIENATANSNNGTVNWTYDISETDLDFLGEGEVVTAVFSITVTDDEGATDTQNVTITLTGNDNNAPIFETGESASSGNTQVSVFSYPNLNGSDSNPGSGNENANLASIIQSVINDGGAYTLDTSIQNFTDDDFEDKLNESGFFFMTDMESGNPNSEFFLPESAQSTIESWVSDGGVIMMTGTYSSNDTDFLNNIFNWDLTTETGSNWSLNEGNAAGTPFEGGPASLNNPSATDSIGRGSVEGFTAIYGTDDNATVATIEYGSGTIIFLGYDFYASGVSGTGFTDTATQYGNDVTTGSSNSNDWVQEIVPRALEYSANLANTSYELSADGGQLTLESDLVVTDSDISNNVTLAVSSMTVMLQNESGESESVTLSDSDLAFYENMFSIANEDAIDTSSSSATVEWSFDSQDEAFGSVAGNESLILTYQIEAEDSLGATATTDITITINGLNDAPDIQVDAETGSVTSTIVEGTTLADSGSITFTDLDLIDTPTATEATSTVTAFAQDGETALTLSETQQTAIEAAFSIESLDSNSNNGTVNWSYDISEANLNFLGAGEVVTAVFTITVTDDEGATDTQDVTITLTGANDGPAIQVDAEAGSVTGTITEGASLTDSGSISFTDLDLTDNPAATEATSSVTALAQDGETALALTSAQQAAIEAAFSIENVNTNTNDGTVNWSYDISEVNLDFLGVGEVVTAVFTITVTDDEGATDTQDVTITLTGTNDAPDIQVDAETGSVTGNIVEGTALTDSGSITFTDVDLTDNPTATEATSSVTALAQDGETVLTLTSAQQAAIEAAFSIENVNTNTNDGTVNWSYNISEVNLDFLGAGEVVTAVFTITVTDDEGATDTQDVTITLTGTNDTPDIQVVDVTGSITEGTMLTDTGSVTFTDVDLTDNPTATEATSSVTAIAQDGATALVLTSAQQSAIEAAFSIENVNTNTNDGTVNWSYNISEANLDFLGAGEVVTAVFTITVTDDEGATDTQYITISLTGTNDTPDIQVDAETGSVTGNIVEGTTLTDSGSITFTDVDLTDNPTATEATSSVTALAQDGETALALTSAQQSAIEAAFSIENVNTNTNDGTVNWSYNISEANLNFLGQGQVVTAVFTITVTDDEGATDTQDVTITLVGDNDTPVALANLPNIAGTSSLVFDPVSLPNNLFQDADFGETQTLTYSIEGLPDGLVFNANSLTISGVPTSGFEGTNLLQLVATDIHGAQEKIPILLTLESAPVAIDASPDTGSATNVPITGFTAPDINLNIDALPSGTFGDGVDSRGFSSESNDSSNGPAEAVAPSSINTDASGAVGNQGNIQVFESQVSVNVDANGQVQITQSDSLDQGSNLSVADIVPQEVGVDIKLTDIGIGSSFSATLSDGTDLPSWVEVDPNTGDVFMDPPEGQEKISLKINAIGSDGVTRVLEVEIDLESLPASVATDAIDSDTVTDAKEGHMTFDQQVELAGNEQDNYGSDLMKLLAS